MTPEAVLVNCAQALFARGGEDARQILRCYTWYVYLSVLCREADFSLKEGDLVCDRFRFEFKVFVECDGEAWRDRVGIRFVEPSWDAFQATRARASSM